MTHATGEEATRFNTMHAPPGSPTGGQFAGGAAAPAKSGHTGGRHPGHGSHAGHGSHGPLTHTLAYNAKTNTGPGYSAKGGDPHVKALQAALNHLGLTDSAGNPLLVDGKLGPRTTQAIKAAQTRLGLTPDGKVTPAFYAQLLAAKTLPHRSASLEHLRKGGRMDDVIVRAELSSAAINDLPDSAFAHIEAGGSKDADGKTIPRSLRHFPIHDEAHVRNALSRAPQSPFGEKAMPKIREAAKRMGISVEGESASRSDLSTWPTLITRSFAIDDAAVRTGRVTCEGCGGDATGRMVDAYAGVFNEPTEVHDQFGHYVEDIDPSAWNKRLADLSRSAAGVRAVNVFYNHALTVHGSPSEIASVPVGHPSVIRTDGRGLLTSTHYSRDPFAERILNGIIDGNISGQSFTGRIIRSDPDRVPRVSRGGDLPRVRRLELGLSEYGPTPQPYYAGALTLAVRAQLPDQHPAGAAGTAPPHPQDVDAGAEEPHFALRSAQENQRRIRRFLVLREGMHDGSHPARTD